MSPVKLRAQAGPLSSSSLPPLRAYRADTSFRRLRTAQSLLTGVGILPLAAFVVLFLVLPVVQMIAGALTTPQGGIGVDNFRRVLGSQYLAAFRTSIEISFETAIFGAVAGTLVAYGIVRGAMQRYRGFTMTLSAVTCNFAGIPLAFAFITTLGVQGWVTTLARLLFHVDLYGGLGFTLYSYTGLTLVYTYFQLPLMVLLIIPAINGLRVEWKEAAQNLGASSWQYWRDIGLPVLTPPLVGATALLFANAFGAYATAYSLSTGAINLVPLRIGMLVDGDVTFDAGLANALGIGMMAVTAAAVLVYQAASLHTRRWVR